MFIIQYGTPETNSVVTDKVYELCKRGVCVIPAGDENRAKLFKDPIFGKVKSIFVTDRTGTTTEYDHTQVIVIDTVEEKIFSPDAVLKQLHESLELRHGRFCDEFPEQRMAVRYLTGKEKVLEIGGNVGRNSLIIGSLLKNGTNNFVSLESSPGIARQLTENRDINGLSFHIENSALSKRPLIQKGWDTIVSDTLLPGYAPVNTISLEQLNAKYNIVFDTLILDCEGAFYYILQDMPEILDNIKLIIMENDYKDMAHKEYIDRVMTEKGFCLDYREAGGWQPCYDCFFEVWIRN